MDTDVEGLVKFDELERTPYLIGLHQADVA